MKLRQNLDEKKPKLGKRSAEQADLDSQSSNRKRKCSSSNRSFETVTKPTVKEQDASEELAKMKSELNKKDEELAKNQHLL